MKAGEFQAERFIEPAHQVKGLDRLASRSFHQIVDRADDDETVRFFVALKSDITIIRAGEPFGLREAVSSVGFANNTDERLVAVILPKNLPNILVVQLVLQENMSRCQCSTDHFN